MSETTRTQVGNASDGTTLSIWWSTLGFALSSATVTINFSPNTTSKAAVLYKVVPGANGLVVVSAVGPGVTGSGTTFSSGTVSVDAGGYIFGFTVAESRAAITGDSDTTNGNWSTALTVLADTGAGGTSQIISGQWKLATGSGNQSYDTTVANARDYALNYLILGEGTTASGATIAAASSAIDGAASGAAGVSGSTLSDGVALLDGVGTGGATADGTVVEVTAGLISGTATGVSIVAVVGGFARLPDAWLTVDGDARGSVLVASATLLSGSASGEAAVAGLVLSGSAVAVLAGRAYGDATVQPHAITSRAGIDAVKYDNHFLLLAA